MRLDLAAEHDIAALVRAATDDSLVVVIAARSPLEMALARAAVGPLAIERAPGMRVNAVVPEQGADTRDVDAAIAFLEDAWSTTGQVLEISAGSGRNPPVRQ
ncbi:Rossmann fold domain-containing protein [Sphingomonas sp. R86521]|uniref:Rossmann fold domain-containing protein n=1 Tax=Sphingomonas sp. R86521 TaxID=3093860 RepID=UPI0036D26C7E